MKDAVAAGEVINEIPNKSIYPAALLFIGGLIRRRRSDQIASTIQTTPRIWLNSQQPGTQGAQPGVSTGQPGAGSGQPISAFLDASGAGSPGSPGGYPSGSAPGIYPADASAGVSGPLPSGVDGGVGPPPASLDSRLMPIIWRAGRRVRNWVEVNMTVRRAPSIDFAKYFEAPQLTPGVVQKLEAAGGPLAQHTAMVTRRFSFRDRRISTSTEF